MSQNDIIGPWSEDKLQLLKKYLQAYTAIMQGQSWCRNGYHYVDAFAGTGKPRARDEERYIDGSPRVALTIQHPFHSYTFIEKTPWRVQRLRELESEFPDRDIRICEGDCNRIITTEITPRIRYELFNRGLIFLDPFGMNTEWSTIEQIAETRALEILMNFPAMALNRTVLPNDPNALTEAQIERMNRFWGPLNGEATFTKKCQRSLDLSRGKFAVPRGNSLASCLRAVWKKSSPTSPTRL